jgi:4-hydroxy-tetrahydrodipicolinate synthase
VTPYYNKATQGGLIAHYTAVADAATKPIIVYNVPSRTGCNVLPSTLSVLADHPMIAAVKEASGNMAQVVEIFQKCGDRLHVYSGEDGLVVPMLAMGGMGCISVLSNVVPKEAVEMSDRFFRGDVAGAAELQLRLLELINCLFCEVNPIPVKAAISAMGFGEEHLRLPLTPMEPQNRARLLAELKKLGVLA